MTHDQTTPAPVDVTQADIIAFLNGEGPLEGKHFGDRDERGRAFWWRKYLDRIAHSAPAGEVEPVAWMYRWKADGEYVNWRYSDASNYHKSLDGYEEKPLYTHPAPPADLVELVEAAAYYIDRLETVQRRVVVRDLREAESAYRAALKHGGA